MKSALGATALLLTSTLAASPAHAAFLIDLTAPATSVGSSYGNVLTYTGMDGGQTVNVQVTSWSNNPATGTITKARTEVYSGGLGVTNSSGVDTGSPQHSVDNNGWVDFLIFQFSRPVDLDQFYIGWVQDTVANPDADATIRSGNVGGAWNAIPGLDGQPVATFNGLLPSSQDSLVATGAIEWRNIAGTSTANWWSISALSPANGTSDYFKVKKISFTAPGGVPEPATWLTMIVGFGAIGSSMRRRKVTTTVRYTATA